MFVGKSECFIPRIRANFVFCDLVCFKSIVDYTWLPAQCWNSTLVTNMSHYDESYEWVILLDRSPIPCQWPRRQVAVVNAPDWPKNPSLQAKLTSSPSLNISQFPDLFIRLEFSPRPGSSHSFPPWVWWVIYKSNYMTSSKMLPQVPESADWNRLM